MEYDDNFKQRSNGASKSELDSHVYYHFIVDKDGTKVQHRKLTEGSRATRNNNNGVHIAMVGNLSETIPPKEQLKAVRSIIDEVRTVFGELKVYEHGEMEGEATQCAGTKFDTSMLSDEYLNGELALKYSAVVIHGKSIEASKNASYARNKCMSMLNDRDGYYGCKNFILTMNAENRNRDPAVVSRPNTNGTRDHGIAQLNSTYHRTFISSPEFKKAENQIVYALEVRQDAKRKGKMPRYGFHKRIERGGNVVFKL